MIKYNLTVDDIEASDACSGGQLYDAWIKEKNHLFVQVVSHQQAGWKTMPSLVVLPGAGIKGI